MKKMLLLCSTMLITACTIQVADATDEPETYCYLKKISYNEACKVGSEYYSEENCYRWMQGACSMQIDMVICDAEFYFQVEECTEVYRK